MNTDFATKSVFTFNQYYPNAFDIDSTKTLIIPSSNDLVDDYFYGLFDDDDSISKYKSDEELLSKVKKIEEAEIKKLESKSRGLMKKAERMVDGDEKKQMIATGNELAEKANRIKTEMKRSDQPLIKLSNIKKYRERISIVKLIGAFRHANIGGILILAPKNSQELKDFIGDHPGFSDFLNEMKQYPEICDCIYFHPILGIYDIEVKATTKLNPMTSEELKAIPTERLKEKLKNKPYDKAVYQLKRTLLPTNEQESMSLLQKLYLLISGSDDFPQISGVVCIPEARISTMCCAMCCTTINVDNLDKRFHHFDSNLLSSIDEFNQFWANELSIYDSVENRNLFSDSNYRKFISTMANCSVGRELFGIKNALKIAQKISVHDYDNIMEKRELNKETIFLNAKQIKILNDKSKLKFIYGPPGTGKTILVILAAIDAANDKKRSVHITMPTKLCIEHNIVYWIETSKNVILSSAQMKSLNKKSKQRKEGKVMVYTREWLVEYMKRIFEENGFDENLIEVGDFVIGYGELYKNDDIFVDEWNANESQIKVWSDTAKNMGNGKIFVAISGQSGLEDLCIVEETIKEVLIDQIDYGIFPLIEILRGTKSIIDFWMNQLNKILKKEFKMEFGHSIIGENVDYIQCLKSKEIMKKMIERLKELLINNEPKNIAIICSDYEKELIKNKLKDEQIAFGSTIEQDNDRTLVAVEETDNVYSREWPFVIFISLFHSDDKQLSIIESSRAIAHLTVIERNENEIHKIIRDKCNNNNEMMKSILSSYKEYSRFRNEIELSDESRITNNDLLFEIVINNHFPSQIAQLFPIFSDCNTFDEFFHKIINEEQWMLLLIIHHFGYLEKLRHSDKSIQLIFVYKQSIEWNEIEENRQIQLNEDTKSLIELMNKYIHIKDKMKIIVNENRNLFEILNNSNEKEQLDLIGVSILRIAMRNWNILYEKREIHLNMTEINKHINQLLFHLNQLSNRQQPMHQTSHNRISHHRCSIL